MASVNDELIGPLTAAEWCEFRLRDDDDDDLIRCCADASEVRDQIFYTLRNGGHPGHGPRALGPLAKQFLESHDYVDGHRGKVLLVKLREYYYKGGDGDEGPEGSGGAVADGGGEGAEGERGDADV